jgi:hypothetical protein
MEIEKVYNRYLCPDCSQYDYICKLLASGCCLTCKKKVCICNDFVKEDWEHLLPTFSSPSAFSPMPSLFSNFDIITPPKAITVPVTKTYATIAATPVNEQVENIKKVYSEKMAKLDRDLSQEVKRHQAKEKQMKYVTGKPKTRVGRKTLKKCTFHKTFYTLHKTPCTLHKAFHTFKTKYYQTPSFLFLNSEKKAQLALKLMLNTL